MTYLDDLTLRVQHIAPVISKLKVVVFDVDGVLTDGSLFYGPDGETLKRFSVKDGVGMKLLQDIGLHVVVITAKDSKMVSARMKDLGVKHYFPGTKDKFTRLQEILSSLESTMDECAYVGDDMVDVPSMQHCCISFCPSDAHALVKESASFILGAAGGKGVAREVCDLVLAGKGKFEKAYKLTIDREFERERK